MFLHLWLVNLYICGRFAFTFCGNVWVVFKFVGLYICGNFYIGRVVFSTFVDFYICGSFYICGLSPHTPGQSISPCMCACTRELVIEFYPIPQAKRWGWCMNTCMIYRAHRVHASERVCEDAWVRLLLEKRNLETHHPEYYLSYSYHTFLKIHLQYMNNSWDRNQWDSHVRCMITWCHHSVKQYQYHTPH